MPTEKDTFGAISINPIHRSFRRFWRKLCGQHIRSRLGKGIGVDWSKTYNILDTIGSIAIKNQGNNYSCSGQAGSYFLEIQRRLKGITEGSISAKSIYAPIAAPGGGATIVALETQIGAHGANLEATIPSYDMLGNPLPEALMTDTSWQTPQLLTEAQTRAGYTPYSVEVNIDSVASAIEAYGAVIMEIEGQNGNTPNWLSPIPSVPQITNNNPLWAHYMCLIGHTIISGNKYIIALQSEGPGWGIEGIQLFGEEYFKSGFILDCFTFISYTTPVPTASPGWQAVREWFIRWFALIGKR